MLICQILFGINLLLQFRKVSLYLMKCRSMAVNTSPEKSGGEREMVKNISKKIINVILMLLM